MKPKHGMVTIKTEPEIGFSKQNLKMAINRTMNQKRGLASDVDGLNRGTVLVNIPGGGIQPTVISNGRNVNGQRNINISNDLLRCKRKINFLPGQTYPGSQPASVARRNARERNRVKQVNNGFATLRSHIPPSVAAALSTEKPATRNTAASKKLSKVETLKMAVEYIRRLQDMLDDHNSGLEKKVLVDQGDRYQMDDSYYSSSPESSSQTVVSSSDMAQQYNSSPERVFPKTEPVDHEYYPTRRIYKSEPDEVFPKSEIYRPKLSNFNQDLHDTLTTEFYHARSPVKQYYTSPERSPVDGYEKNYEQLGDMEREQSSPIRHYSASPKGNLTVLNLVPSGQVLQYVGHSLAHSFVHPRMQHRSSTSLSPTVSDACPSPTPSFSSDHSSVHPSSVVSSSSGHLTSRLSRLTTVSSDHYQPMSSPVLRSGSPNSTVIMTDLTPPRNTSPVSVVSSGVVTSATSGGSSSPTYSNGGAELQKGSPEVYDSYEPMSPEDEELLDAISWWQQSH